MRFSEWLFSETDPGRRGFLTGLLKGSGRDAASAVGDRAEDFATDLLPMSGTLKTIVDFGAKALARMMKQPPQPGREEEYESGVQRVGTLSRRAFLTGYAALPALILGTKAGREWVARMLSRQKEGKPLENPPAEILKQRKDQQRGLTTYTAGEWGKIMIETKGSFNSGHKNGWHLVAYNLDHTGDGGDGPPNFPIKARQWSDLPRPLQQHLMNAASKTIKLDNVEITTDDKAGRFGHLMGKWLLHPDPDIAFLIDERTKLLIMKYIVIAEK